jgi:hypothetical protein
VLQAGLRHFVLLYVFMDCFYYFKFDKLFTVYDSLSKCRVTFHYSVLMPKRTTEVETESVAHVKQFHYSSPSMTQTVMAEARFGERII